MQIHVLSPGGKGVEVIFVIQQCVLRSNYYMIAATLCNHQSSGDSFGTFGPLIILNWEF